MNNDRKFPWLNVWMIAFGVIGIWANFAWYNPQTLIGWSQWISFTLGASIPLFILLVGVLRFPGSSPEPAVEAENLTLADLGGIYLVALHKIRRHKWILTIFGVIAVVAFVGAVADLSLYAQYRTGNPMMAEPPPGQSNPGLLKAVVDASPRVFLDGLNRSLSSFRIGNEIRNSGGIAFFLFSLLFLIAATCYQRKITGLTREPDLARRARFAAAILLPAAIVFWLVGLLQVKTVLSATAMTAPQNPNILLALVRHIFVAMVAGLTIGGLAGSLRRMGDEGSVTRDTFLADIVRYFWPVMGIYLLIEVTWTLLTLIMAFLVLSTGSLAASIPAFRSVQDIGFAFLGLWPIVALLLVLAPYAAVRHDFGMWAAIRQGISDLRRNLWDAVSFIVLGVTFAGVVYTLLAAMSINIRHSDFMLLRGTVTSAIGLTATAVISAVMVIAGWDFYVRISGREREPVGV